MRASTRHSFFTSIITFPDLCISYILGLGRHDFYSCNRVRLPACRLPDLFPPNPFRLESTIFSRPPPPSKYHLARHVVRQVSFRFDWLVGVDIRTLSAFEYYILQT